MPRPDQVKGIVIHCTAGYGDVNAMKRFWRSKGWHSPGYHRVIDRNGRRYFLKDYSGYTNGVKGYNDAYIHIAYIGGVEKNNHTNAKDTRTAKQKLMLEHYISDVMLWLKSKGQDTDVDFCVVGHRDFSPDQDNNGIIASWERIKECPSFDAMHEYAHYTSIDRRLKLPTDR